MVDLSGYNNWRFNVWNSTHTTMALYTAAGPTGSALGIAAWTVPEDASFHSQIAAAIALGQDTVTLYWDLIADAGAVAGQTTCVLRGQLTLKRFEGAP